MIELSFARKYFSNIGDSTCFRSKDLIKETWVPSYSEEFETIIPFLKEISSLESSSIFNPFLNTFAWTAIPAFGVNVNSAPPPARILEPIVPRPV